MNKDEIIDIIETLEKRKKSNLQSPSTPPKPQTKTFSKTLPYLKDYKINDTFKKKDVEIWFREMGENKKKFSFKKSPPLAYVLFCGMSNNLEIKEVVDIKVQQDLEKNNYHWLDKAIFTYKNKPVFWIYKNNIITVDNLKTEKEKFIAVFNPESWYNIYNNVVTYKLTGGTGNDLGGIIGKYWKYGIVLIVVIIGFLVQSGVINIQ